MLARALSHERAQLEGPHQRVGVALALPRTEIQQSVSLRTATHDGDLLGEAQRVAGGWTLDMLPADTSELPTRPVKLVDARTGRPVARATVRLEYLVGPLARRAASLTSSPLGWVFVPFEVTALSNERAWVTAPGYRRTRLEFTAQDRRTRLRPE